MYFGHSNRGYSGSSGGGGGFIPQSGYSYSGTVAIDGLFTLSNGSNPFGSTGPTLLAFDNFSSTPSGAVMGGGGTTQAPMLGSGTWNTFGSGGNSGHQYPPPYISAGNRTGTGNCLRLVPSSWASYTPYQMWLTFGQNVTELYTFRAEYSHGFDYGVGQSNNGNNWNYKMQWLTYNNLTGNCFNEWVPAVFGSSGVASRAIGSNDQTYLPADIYSRDGTVYDPNNWNSLEAAYIGNAANPTGADGYVYLGNYNVKNGGLIAGASSGYVLFNSTAGSSGPRSYANTLSIPGILQGFPTGTTIDITDSYIATGTAGSSMCRALIGNAGTLNGCTETMICDIVSWSAGAIEFHLRQGPFSSLSGNYLYWFDSSNNSNLAGQFS